MAKRIKMTAQDRIWQAHDDARTLVQAGIVTSDKARLRAAKTQAKIMAKEKAQEIKAIKKIAKRK